MKHVFLVGCPRSGTTWLQILLAHHALVATAPETHLFSGYLQHLDRQWELYESQGAPVGLKEVFSKEEYYGLCAAFAQGVSARIASSNPAATVVLEKTPNHVRYAPLILKLVPDAYFVHMVRDPRSVVSPLRAAGQSWGGTWASRSVLSNVRLWRADVNRGREIRRLTERVREVRYEDLRGTAGASVLHDLYVWLDLPADPEFAARALETCEIRRMRDGGTGVRAFESVPARDAKFFRQGTTDGWKNDLTLKEIEIVEYAAGGLMHNYGYNSPRVAESGRSALR